jgi:hypothetical protein
MRGFFLGLKMKNIYLFSLLFLAACASQPRPNLNIEQLKTGGYVFATMTIDGGGCDGGMVTKKIESVTPLKLEEKLGDFISFGPNPSLNPFEILQGGFDARPSYFQAGNYAVTNASCVIRSGNTTSTFSLGHAGTGTIATFEVKSGEVVDLGQLKLEAAYKWSFLSRKFSHIKSRNAGLNAEKTVEIFKQKNPSYASNIISRVMVATPTAIRPETETPQ